MRTDKNTKQQAAKILRKASKIIDNRHWIRNDLHSENGNSHCALGAIQVAAKEYSENEDHVGNKAMGLAREALLKQIQKVYPGVSNIPEFNDSLAKSAKDVIQQMRAAAQSLTKSIRPAAATVKKATESASQYFFSKKGSSLKVKRAV